MWGSSNMIAGRRSNQWWLISTALVLIGFLAVDLVLVTAEPSLSQAASGYNENQEKNYVRKALKFLELNSKPRYEHEWPDMRLGWKIVVGSIFGFVGAAFGSVGGVGGGGIFVPMLALIIGFDPKSSTAISKCMITGAAAATVCYNIRQRHPTLELPLIDYDLALLFQPMLVLGISIGVGFNVIFADWMITILLIILFIGISTKSFFKGVETWKKETIKKKEAARQLDLNGNARDAVEIKTQNEATTNDTQTGDRELGKSKVSLIKNIRWKELGLLIVVWILILALQIAKNYSTTCSVEYWVLNFLQIPVAVGVSSYEAVCLYKGRRRIASKGDVVAKWRVHKLVIYCAFGVLAGTLGGMLGLGGGFILGPLFLEMGIPPQVSSATSTFAMLFSASMSVVEYYLLKRFPVPYALYLALVATIAAFVGQHVVGKVIKILGRASIIIFILAGMIFGSAISLGGLGIAKMIKRIERKEYMGFDDICSYQP
ncbi:sulfite exporter TauE/SafE family protein 3-like [Herrania umbratica]|uniref:Sulfite exporter TauE/SafE family protein 3-like n=1 Tax=Herrania umbratica TaxID=108875 RepID=A0A6J1BGP1_9ROSI|nr:sulfite exporter TauE/SafE family protein 3-like [Herrania umbratica]